MDRSPQKWHVLNSPSSWTLPTTQARARHRWIGIAGARPPPSISGCALRGPPSSAEASLQSAGSTGRRPPPARSPPPHAAREEKTSVARTHELTHRRLPSGWDGTAVLGGMRCGCGAAAEIPIPNLRRLAVLRRRGSRKQPRTAHGPAANPEQPQHSCADQRRFSDGGRGDHENGSDTDGYH
jgi:hypothetical protein